MTGFVSSYEIMHTVRSAGFEPLAPPLREGTTYVLRATDFRGILMRVVLDARTGVIRDVTRIVPGAATPGPYGMMPPPYGPPPYASPLYGPPPYGAPAEYDVPAPGTAPAEDGAPTQLTRPAAAPPVAHPALSARPSSPPLPRPRPAALASHKTQNTQKPEKTEKAEKAEKSEKPAGGAHPENGQPRPGANANTIGVNAGAGPAPSTAPGKAPPVAPLND